jgi:hypothetical protein
MTSLAQQRCFNHAAREAVALCPECGRCFCRECVTEHEDRVICAACLNTLARPSLIRRRRFVRTLRMIQALFGLMTAWFFFYLLGQVLLTLPSSFHEGTVWQIHWWEEK